MTRDARRLIEALRAAVHGGNALSSTSRMLDTLSREPSVIWPLFGGLRPEHLRERASFLCQVDSLLESLGAELDRRTRESRETWLPVSELLPNVRVVLGRWQVFDHTDGSSVRHWQQATGWRTAVVDSCASVWHVDGCTFDGHPFYDVEPTHFMRVAPPPEA